MGIGVARLEEEGGKRIADTNNVVVGGLPSGWNVGLYVLRQLFGRAVWAKWRGFSGGGGVGSVGNVGGVSKNGGMDGGVGRWREKWFSGGVVPVLAWAAKNGGVGVGRRRRRQLSCVVLWLRPAEVWARSGVGGLGGGGVGGLPSAWAACMCVCRLQLVTAWACGGVGARRSRIPWRW